MRLQGAALRSGAAPPRILRGRRRVLHWVALLAATVLLGGVLALCCCTNTPATNTPAAAMSSTASASVVLPGHTEDGDPADVHARVLPPLAAAEPSVPGSPVDGDLAASWRPSTGSDADSGPGPANRDRAARFTGTAADCGPPVPTPTLEAGSPARLFLPALAASPFDSAATMAWELPSSTPHDSSPPAPRPSPYALCVIRT